VTTVLSVDGVSKKFCHQLRRALAYGLRDIAGELIPGGHARGHLRPDEFWVLRDVSFELKAGESLAVVGRNGAGKSTLLKILAGLLKPDAGQARVAGRTEALIELGTGFNPLLTGRENIAIGAALHGLDGAGTRRLTDEVIDFSELEPFIDSPLQSYSSGMKARLAYALSAHLEPDLLLVDEVLAVGDVSFQRKSVNHMRRYLDRGGSLLLVSHNAYQIQAVCKRGIVLDQGKLAFAGTAVEALNHLFESVPAQALAHHRSTTASTLRIESVTAHAAGSDTLRTGEPMGITLDYCADEDVEASWGFGVWTSDQWVCITGAYEEGRRLLPKGRGQLSCTIPSLPLLPGRYIVRAVVVDPETRYPHALFGWNDAGLPIHVSALPSPILNGQAQINQLMTVDVDWE
jgi:lipopolysaccharide transport system ATP-binding protein